MMLSYFAFGCVIVLVTFRLATPGDAISPEPSTSSETWCLPHSMSAWQIQLDGGQSETPKEDQFINITKEETDKWHSSET